MSTPFALTPDIDESLVRFREIVPGGASWSHVLKRGTSLRLTDPHGGANVAVLLYNFELLTERLNVPDSLKAQHTAKLRAGHCLYSDMGRILVSIPKDSLGWHDPLAGHSTAATIEKTLGKKSFQEARNHYHRNAKNHFLVELNKYGLDQRDLVMNVNFFSKVVVDEAGNLIYHADHSLKNSFLDLRAEMNTLIILNTCSHPMAPAGSLEPSPIHLTVWSSPPVTQKDICRTSCPENARGYELTERYFL